MSVANWLNRDNSCWSTPSDFSKDTCTRIPPMPASLSDRQLLFVLDKLLGEGTSQFGIGASLDEGLSYCNSALLNQCKGSLIIE
jgi:hypothetical protein